MIYNPGRLLIVGWLVHLIIYLVSPLETHVDIIPTSLIFIAITSLAFILGSNLHFYKKNNSASPCHILSPGLVKKEKILFTLFLLLGILGNALRMIDRHVIRGDGMLFGMEGRELLLDNLPTLVSVVG